jgi:PIN domain nuclease of toxin-antitoxin system
LIFLDTHVAVWLFAEADRIPASVQTTLDAAELYVSPMVRLELSLLNEIKRLRDPASAVLGALSHDIGLEVEESGWVRAAEIADHLTWTRDPFDRLIAAHAMAFGAALCTRDSAMRNHYAEAFWES